MYSMHLQGWMKHLDFILLDDLLLQLALIIAYVIRHSGLNIYSSDLYRDSALILLLSGVLCAVFFDLHKNVLKRGIWQELKNMTQLAVGSAGCLLGYIFFARHTEDFSRLTLLYFVLISVPLLWIANMLWKRLVIASRKVRGFKRRHLLLLTHSGIAEYAIERMQKSSYGLFDIVGLVMMDARKKTGDEILGIPVVCEFHEAIEYMQTRWIDEVMIFLPKEIEPPETFLNRCAEMGITTHLRLNVKSDQEVQQTIEKYAGCTVLTESLRIASARQVFFKRLLDILGAIVGLFCTAVLTVIIGPIIYFTDPKAGIFFSQKRVGQNGRIFKIYKFRSMYSDAEERKASLMEKNKMQGLMFKVDDDPRILGSGPDGKRHGIGWFIRKTSIDEFPQFWNVLKGEMSLVGTRPPTLDEWEKYEAHHRARMAGRPGLTGLWQISGRSDIQNFEEVIQLDMKYLNTWTIGEDIRIILETVKVMVTGRGAE